jgi:hypothetical protein
VRLAQRDRLGVEIGELKGAEEVLLTLVVSGEGFHEAAQLVRLQRLLETWVAAARARILHVHDAVHAREGLHVVQPRQPRLAVEADAVAHARVVHAEFGEH